MAYAAFSEEWASQWCAELNSNQAYRTAAARWEGAVALVVTGTAASGEPTRAVFLDLWHGECRGARVATPEDVESARYVLTGTAATWKSVLLGETPPMTALMGGGIRLARGSMVSLLPYAAAARELVGTVTRIEVSFPEGW